MFIDTESNKIYLKANNNSAIFSSVNGSMGNAAALGYNAVVTKKGDVAVGYAAGNSTASAEDDSKRRLGAVSVGHKSYGTGDCAVAVGSGANAAATNTSAIGGLSKATGTMAIALGYKAEDCPINPLHDKRKSLEEIIEYK